MADIPYINISIVPSITVPYVAIRAEWKYKNDTLHGAQTVLHVDEFKPKVALIVERLVEEVLRATKKTEE